MLKFRVFAHVVNGCQTKIFKHVTCYGLIDITTIKLQSEEEKASWYRNAKINLHSHQYVHIDPGDAHYTLRNNAFYCASVQVTLGLKR